MNRINKFDISKLKGSLAKIRDWMRNHHLPPMVIFYILGIISTIWFLIRIIPKPSRAGYPCMRVAAPFMSGFVVYLLSLGGITIALRKARQNIIRARYMVASSFILAALVGLISRLKTPRLSETFIVRWWVGNQRRYRWEIMRIII